MANGYIVVIQFENTYIQDFRNVMIRDLSILQNYDGKPLGIGETLHVKEGSWRPRRAIALFEFPNSKKAQLWVESDPALHQPDFMHGSDVFLVPAKFTASPHSYAVLFDIRMQKQQQDYFEKNYAAEHVKSLNAGNGNQIVATTHSVKHRGLWDTEGNLLVINQFPNENCFEKWYCGGDYSAIRGNRERCSSSSVVSFQLHPLCLKR